MGINFTFDLEKSDAAITKDVILGIERILNFAATSSMGAMRPRLQELLERILRNSDGYADILVGHLRAELGLSEPRTALEAIVNTLKEEVFVTYTPYRHRAGQFVGGIRVGVVIANFESILSLPTSQYMSNSYNIPWLSWLLLGGSRVLVNDYHSVYSHRGFHNSRTGRTLMFKGGSWSVTPTSSTGVRDNNWITRALDYFVLPATDIILEEFTKRL